MTHSEANAAQEDMLISHATDEDLRALCQMLQAELRSLRAELEQTRLAAEIFKAAAELNMHTIQEMQRERAKSAH